MKSFYNCLFPLTHFTQSPDPCIRKPHDFTFSQGQVVSTTFLIQSSVLGHLGYLEIFFGYCEYCCNEYSSTDVFSSLYFGVHGVYSLSGIAGSCESSITSHLRNVHMVFQKKWTSIHSQEQSANEGNFIPRSTPNTGVFFFDQSCLCEEVSYISSPQFWMGQDISFPFLSIFQVLHLALHSVTTLSRLWTVWDACYAINLACFLIKFGFVVLFSPFFILLYYYPIEA